MHAFAPNCTSASSPGASSTDVLLDRLALELGMVGVDLGRERVVDHEVRPGGSSDEGDGDQWPPLTQGIPDAEIFVLATPIWLGPAAPATRARACIPTFVPTEEARSDDAPIMDRQA